ncbi:hypothetical protein BS47DRAFT_1367028 [Hydnum rufescens UP504]|uniref:Uncharacterized protein n=1 Tax=Hydnum rufescens UP504 TaxID=1448309 RepID=A0A9P6DQ08_9AGAM|nr:hypothetical protein BS47DRAFT_1367028 [Hydnum rufescens UP504]
MKTCQANPPPHKATITQEEQPLAVLLGCMGVPGLLGGAPGGPLILGMLFKDKRAPFAWAGFQKTFKDMNKKLHDQSLQVWTCDIVASAYNAHRVLLDEEGLKKFKDDMIQHCLDNEESKDLSKVLKGGCTKVMDQIGNQLSHQA